MRNLLVMLICLIAIPAGAATTEIQRETVGYGGSYQDALSSALLEAVRQVGGLEVGTEKVLQADISSSINAAGHALVASAQLSTDIYTKSKGRIKSYQVLKVKEPANAGDPWQVIALVTVPVYQNAGPKNDARKTIAVLPFNVLPDNIVSYSRNLALNNITTRIADSIAVELNQSRKFAVLNRSFESQFAKERALLGSDQVSASEASRLGQKLGADYLVLGKIYQLDFDRVTKDYYDYRSNPIEATIELSYTVIEAATERVMWSDTVTYKVQSTKEKEVVGEFVSGLSTNIVSNVLDVIYPIRILKLLNAENIVLNQGGNRLNEGQIMAVYTKGESMIDSDTGLSIQIDGNKVAEIEVTQVKPTYSIAKLLPSAGGVAGKGTSQFSDLSVNAIARRMTQETIQETAPSRELTAASREEPLDWSR